MKDELNESRKEIDEIDSQMAELFERRMSAAQNIAKYKSERGMPIFDPEREDKIIRRNSEKIADDETRGYYTAFLRETMRLSREYQRRLMQGMRIAYSGIEGAFAYIAAEKIFPGAQKKSFGSFKAAYDSVVDGECDAAVLPLENSSAGEVGQVTDLLFSGPLYMNGTSEIAVLHDLIAVPGTKLEDVTTVVSHPQALTQCSKFIRKNGYKEIAYANTALAAKYVAELNDPHTAAIASEDSADLYGLKVLVSRINESYTNTTRFAVLSRSENRNSSSMHGASFALMFTVKNEAGALARALNIIGAHDFNLRVLRSRPMKELMWQYYFYVEAEGNVHTAGGRSMMEELGVCCDKLKLLGSFIKMGPQETEEKE